MAVTKKGGEKATGKQQYRAPALEKGLEILELLARQNRPFPMAEISAELQKSTGELFRMLYVLESKGYITRSASGDGYLITDKLFRLGMEQPKISSLTETAHPVMRELTEKTGQSCHLVIPSHDQIVVILRVESRMDIAVSVRIGHRLSIVEATSGTVLFSFQPEHVQEQWLSFLRDDVSAGRLRAFVDLCANVRKKGFARHKSSLVAGITDLSAPILRGDRCQAALTIPYVETDPIFKSIDDCIPLLREAAATLSNAATFGDEF